MAKLIVVAGPGAGNEHELGTRGGGGTFVAGRDPRNKIALPDGAASRKHFGVEGTLRGWRLSDLASRNQTFLNGTGVKEAFLRDGDVIRAGDTELRFEDPGDPVESAGGASTIIKEMSAGARAAKAGGGRDTFLERLASLEGSCERAGSEAAPKKALASARRLVEAYEALAAAASVEDLFRRLLAEVITAVGAERAAVVAREGQSWVIRAAQGESEGAGGLRASDSILARALEEEKAILSSRAAAGPGGSGKTDGGIASVIAAPIMAGGKTASILYAERRESNGPFTEEDLQFLTALCEPAGSVLEKLEVEASLRRENRNLFRSITDAKRIVGRSNATESVLEFIRRAAPTPMTVLIQGETGTGKELVASAIHYASPRRGQPFVALNCAALPENLVESELFGHERGAFTGAVTRRKGRFELADRGTVFLDEVGELSLACQAKLLRLLEERELDRVGGVEPVKVDVRVIAATNKDLLAAVGGGSFREDLYYRLSVLNLRIPPLRERVEDIPLLAVHFLEACGAAKKLSKTAEKKLLGYGWPGNARQLRNVIESAVVLGDGADIRPDDLVLPPRDAREGAKGEAAWEPITLESLERLHIERVMEHTGGNKKRAAEILGIERCTLYSKLKAYGR